MSLSKGCQGCEYGLPQNHKLHHKANGCVPFFKRTKIEKVDDTIDDVIDDDIEEGEITCWGCIHDAPGQRAHMNYGGCLYEESGYMEKKK